jgi:putative ABC transport system ATP-binding protein
VEVRSLYREPEAAPAASAPALEAVDVFKIFRAGPVETVALRGVSLRVEPGEAVAVLGPSGSGKSTLLQLAAGLLEPSAGEIRIDGRPLGHMDDAELSAFRAQHVSVVFQRDNLWPALTAEDNVRLSALLAGRRVSRRDACDALAAMGVAHRRDHRPAMLSGGEQQRVAIAAALVRQPSLVLADEPTGELDAANERLVVEDLRALWRDGTCAVVVATHSPRLAEAAGRVLELRDGAVA